MRIKLIVKNKKAKFDYEILETVEAGLLLLGTEIKSIREGKVSIKEAYARIRNGELFIYNMDIAPYKYAGPQNHEPKRVRKLLLHKRQIKRLQSKVEEKGLTLIPLALYLKRGWAKLEIALARGRKLYDKRELIKKREVERQLRRQLRWGRR